MSTNGTFSSESPVGGTELEHLEVSPDVIEEMNRYFIEVLEPKHQAFGGLAPCPYVQAERIASRIHYRLCDFRSVDPTEVMIREFADAHRSDTLLALNPASTMDLSECLSLGVELCERLSDIGIIAICVHPEDELQIGGFLPRKAIPYPTLLIQAREAIFRAKRSLLKSGYYVNWSLDDLAANEEQFGRFL